MRVTGAVRAEALTAGARALGAPAFTALQVMQVVGERQARIVPDVSVSGDGQAGLLGAVLGGLAREQGRGERPASAS